MRREETRWLEGLSQRIAEGRPRAAELNFSRPSRMHRYSNKSD